MTGIVIDLDKIQQIEDVINLLTATFGIQSDLIPTTIGDFTLDEFSYEQKINNFQLFCQVTIAIAKDEEEEAVKELSGQIVIELTEKNGVYTVVFGGQLYIPLTNTKNLAFDLYYQSKTLASSDTSRLIVGQLSTDQEQQDNIANVTPFEIISEISPELGELFPEELLTEFKLNQNFIFVISIPAIGTPKKFLFGIGFNTQLELAKLPLVGSQLPPEITNASFTIELLISLQTFEKKELKNINGFLTELTAPLKIKPPSSSGNKLYRGAAIAISVNLGQFFYAWLTRLKRRTGSYAIGDRRLAGVGNYRLITSTRSSSEYPEEVPVTVGENGTWLTLQKSFGPIHFEKLGLLYKEGKIHLGLEGSLEISKFTLSLIELSISTPLKTDFEPQYNLQGFGLEYDSDSLEIGGAFARIVKPGYEDYLGIATLGMKVKGKALSLAAVGSFAYYQGEPAFFLYLAVNYPLGGPAFFFVTGLAGGFGYNRSLTVPPLEQLPAFPLVAQAMDGSGSINFDDPGVSIGQQLNNLAKYIAVSPGSGFLAVGVKFTSFKLIESFALLTAAINEDKFELNLIGNSRVAVPSRDTGFDPIAQAEIILQARFAPSEGILSVRAQLTPASYIISDSCRLTGGFAFCVWYAGEHAGDFVITLGGYHPAFKVPSHYPKVPRLGFNWQIDGNTSVTGEAYFALCSHAVMAGGRLSLDYDDGWAWASYSISSDFLICWKPYYYDISAHISISAGISFVSGSLGVSVHLWGPELGGTFEIDFWIASVTVKFGDQGSRDPLPIDWDDFRSSFLPLDEEICSIAATEGLVKQLKVKRNEIEEEVWILNPKQFALATDAFIPSKKTFLGGEEETNGHNQTFGINPMGLKESELQTAQHITITRGGDSCEEEFKFTPVTKKAPTAMWGQPNLTDKGRLKLPDANAQQFVDDVVFGFQIVPAKEPQGGNTNEIPLARLQYDIDLFDLRYSWETLSAFVADPANDSGRRQIVRDTVVSNPNRDSLLEALGFDPAQMVDVKAAIADEFIFAPLVK